MVYSFDALKIVGMLACMTILVEVRLSYEILSWTSFEQHLLIPCLQACLVPCLLSAMSTITILPTANPMQRNVPSTTCIKMHSPTKQRLLESIIFSLGLVVLFMTAANYSNSNKCSFAKCLSSFKMWNGRCLEIMVMGNGNKCSVAFPGCSHPRVYLIQASANYQGSQKANPHNAFF